MDWSSMLNAVVVAVVPGIVYYVRLGLPKLPRVVVWALPMVLGSAVSALGQLISAPGMDPLKGALLGALALVLRELVSTVKEHGVNG